MKLIAFPLVILAFLAVFSTIMSLEEMPTEGSVYTYGETDIDTLYYDSYGNPLCYANGTEYYTGDDGFITSMHGDLLNRPIWRNSTGDYVCRTPDGTTPDQVHTQEFDMLTGLGYIAVIAGIMFVVSFVGIRVFGNGLAEASVHTIIIGTVLITMWLVFSALSIGLLAEVPAYLGGVFYFMLTVMYAIGVVQHMRGGS